MENHYVGKIDNPWKKKTNVLWAVEPVGKAIIFVHGFKGDYETWRGFPELLADDPKLEGWDVFFPEYDWRNRAQLTGTSMYEFLKAIFASPASVFTSSKPALERDDPTFKYTEVILVAHSLGAVVVRVALLTAHKAKAGWLDRTKMVLYAPAHQGANIISLGSEALGALAVIGKIIPPLLKGWFPSLIDLEVSGTTKSELLNRLESETQALLDAGSGEFTKARAVLFGEDDRVVVPSPFCGDAIMGSVPGVGHGSICKPTTTFIRPYETLVQTI